MGRDRVRDRQDLSLPMIQRLPAVCLNSVQDETKSAGSGQSLSLNFPNNGNF